MFFLPSFLYLWKFHPPSKAQLEHSLLHAVFLDLPVPGQLFCTGGPIACCLPFSKSGVLEDRD